MSAPQDSPSATPAVGERPAGAVEVIAPPREFVEWMAEDARPTDLWWNTTVRGVTGPYWHRLETTAQIADLVHALTGPQDKLVLEDDAGYRLHGCARPGIMAP